MKCRDDLHVLPLLPKHLTRNPGAGGMRYCIVAVEELETVTEHHFMHAHSERQVVRRILEEWISPDVHLVKEHVRQIRRQPERLTIGYEMDLVPAPRESDAELRRDSARASVSRITGDADLQVTSASPSPVFHQRSTIAALSGSSGSTRVTLPAAS